MYYDDERPKRKCPKCKKNDAQEEHKCPYDCELGDGKKLCRCCGECRSDCAMDV